MNSVFGINSFTGLYAGTNTPDLAATAETTATDWTKGASAKTLLEESQKVQRAERLEQRKEAEANMKRLEDNARAIAFALKTKEMQKALATLQQDNSQSSHLMLLMVTDEGDIHAFFPPPPNAFGAGSGNDAVSYAGGVIKGIETGDGSDAVALTGDVVEDVHTDRQNRGTELVVYKSGGARMTTYYANYSAADSLAISAQTIRKISTGGGNDAVALNAETITGLDTGTGDDALSISARHLNQVNTGDGNDSLAIRAGVVSRLDTGSGDDVLTLNATVLDGVRTGDGNDVVNVVLNDQSGDGLDFPRYARLHTGSGDDTLSLAAQGHVTFGAGTGDDTVLLSKGSFTMALQDGAAEGNDVVTLSDGADLALMVSSEKAASATIVKKDDALLINFGDGSSVTVKGLANGGTVALALPSGQVDKILKQEQAVDLRM